MEIKLVYEFNVDREQKTIYILREFTAAKSLVWKAFTDAQYLKKWWAPAPYRLETKIMEFENDGKWLYAMISPEGERHYGLVNFISIKTENFIIQRNCFSDENGFVRFDLPENESYTSFLELDDEMGLRTRLIMKLTFESLEHFDRTLEMGFQNGIHESFEQLDDLIDAQA